MKSILQNEKRTIRLAYFTTKPNVGDAINPQLIDELFNLDTTSPVRGRPYLLAIGSLMAMANRLAHVWGTGVMGPSFRLRNVQPQNIHALRGKLSYEFLRNNGIQVKDVPLGDPGYLAPVLLTEPVTRSHPIGLVPHYHDRELPWVQKALSHPDVMDLDVRIDPGEFLLKMAACEVIISSSLHGLIFAEALALPNVWIKLSDKIPGGRFKYDDWFSLTAVPQKEPAIPNAPIHDIARRASLHECQIDKDALIYAFPSIPELISE